MGSCDLSFARMLTVAMLLGVAGCVAVDPSTEIPGGTPYVRISNGGSMFGSSSATVYEGDVAVFRAAGPDVEDRVSLVTLRAGAFERIEAAALRIMSDVESLTGPQCLDYGIDVIEVNGPDATSRLEAACPDEDMRAAQNDLRRLLNEEIVE